MHCLKQLLDHIRNPGHPHYCIYSSVSCAKYGTQGLRYACTQRIFSNMHSIKSILCARPNHMYKQLWVLFQNDSTMKLLFCEYIISFSLMLIPSCHSPYVSEKIEKGQKLLYPTQNLIFNIYKIVTKSLFYRYRSKLHEIISIFSHASAQNMWSSLVHALLSIVAYSTMLILRVQLASKMSNYISHPVYLKTTGIFLSNRSINFCILNKVHVSIFELITPLNTANKVRDLSIFPVFFTKIKPNWASLQVKTSIASTYHQRLSSRSLFQGWY